MKQKDFLKIGTNCRDSGHWDSITEFETILSKSGHSKIPRLKLLIKTDKNVNRCKTK